MNTEFYDKKGLRPFLVILLVLLAMVITSGAVYWYFNNQNNNNHDLLQNQIYSLETAIALKKSNTTSTPTPTTTTTPAPTATTNATDLPATPADNTVTYSNTKFGFKLTLPSTWTKYVVGTKDDGDSGFIYYVGLPTTDTSYVQDPGMPSGSVSLFAITVFTKAQWAAVQASGDPIQSTVIDVTSDKYVFTWSSAQANPEDLTKYRADVAAIIASFKLN